MTPVVPVSHSGYTFNIFCNGRKTRTVLNKSESVKEFSSASVIAKE